MSVSSPCEICLRRDVQHTCDRCGQLICGEHFDRTLGVCVECVADFGGGPGHTPTEDDQPDGTETYRF